MLIENDGANFIYHPLGNYAYGDLSMPETLLDNRNCIMGLGDGGAHVAFILDAGYQTWLLSHWGRDEKRWDVAELIRRLTSDTAGAAGLHDRGVLAVGKKADVNIIDWEKLGAGAPYVVNDLPAGGKRLSAEGHRLRCDDCFGPADVPRGTGDRHAAGQAGARAAGGTGCVTFL